MLLKKKKKKEGEDGFTQIVISGLIQGLGTLFSRISGLIRDILMARVLGASALTDAFFISFKIPNSIRKLIGEGAMSTVFVPLFIERKLKGVRESREFTGIIFLTLGAITFGLTMLGEVFAEQIINFAAPGFAKNQDIREKAIILLRIMLPSMFFTISISTLGGALNGMKKFFYFAIMPLIINVTITIFLLLPNTIFQDKYSDIAASINLAGIIQLLLMIYSCHHHKILPIISFKWGKIKGNVGVFFIRLLPILFGQGVFQINMFVDAIFASMTDSTASYLYYTDRLHQFAVSIIGHTLGIVALPILAQHIKNNNMKEATEVKSQCISLSSIWSMPAAACLAALSGVIVEIIYKHGAFDSTDTNHVSTMLSIACISIPFISANRIYYSCLYAIDKIKTTVAIGLCSVVSNITLNNLLHEAFPHYSVIISTTSSCIFEWFLLNMIVNYRYKFAPKNIKTFTITIKALAVSLALGYSCHAAEQYFDLLGSLKYVKLTAIIFISILAYCMAMISIGGMKAEIVFSLINRLKLKFKAN